MRGNIIDECGDACVDGCGGIGGSESSSGSCVAMLKGVMAAW